MILIAAAMGLAAVCLVVFGTTQKQLQIGVLLGLWGYLLRVPVQVVYWR